MYVACNVYNIFSINNDEKNTRNALQTLMQSQHKDLIYSAKTKRKEQRQCEVIRWHTTKLDQFTSESVSNPHTVDTESQGHYWERKSRPIGQNCCSRSTSYRQHESNHHKLRQKANLQRSGSTMVKSLEKQYQKGKPVSKKHIGCEPKS